MKFLLLCILIVNILNGAGKSYGDIFVSEVTSIYDGDTFRASIKGYPAIVGERISIRLNGVDTPELRGKCQQEKDLARLAKQFTVQTLRSAKMIELRNMKRGKYFRIIADVYVDRVNLSEALIRKGLGVAYHGGTKVKDWCE